MFVKTFLLTHCFDRFSLRTAREHALVQLALVSISAPLVVSAYSVECKGATLIPTQIIPLVLLTCHYYGVDL